MKELLTTFFETSKERIKNPLIGAFIFSWIAFNWRPILILLFSEKQIEGKLTLIGAEYSSINHALWFPLLAALFYVVILPYFSWLLEFALKKAVEGRGKNLIEQQKNNIIDKQILAIEEIKLEDIKANYREKADLNRHLEDLMFEVNEKEKIISGKDETINSLKSDVERLQLEIQSIFSDNIEDGKDYSNQNSVGNSEYEKFKQSGLFQYFKVIGTMINNSNLFPSQIPDIILQKYIVENIIEDNGYINGQESHKFTEKGEHFWKEYVLAAEIPEYKEEENELEF